MAVINSSFCRGFCPAVLKNWNIKPVPKPNSPEYPPISLLSHLGKAMERIVTWHMGESVDLPSIQFRCRPFCSVSEAPALFLHNGGIARGSSEKFAAVFLHMTKVYDGVPKSILYTKLVITDTVPPGTIRWICSWPSQ